MLIGDHVVDLPSSILEQHIFLRVLDTYPLYAKDMTHCKFSVTNIVLWHFERNFS